MSDFYIGHECDEMKEALERGCLVASDENIDEKGNCHIVSLPGNAPSIRYCPWCGKVVSNLATSTSMNFGKRETCQLMRNSLGDITPYPETPDCEECDGRGRVDFMGSDNMDIDAVICRACRGTGKAVSQLSNAKSNESADTAASNSKEV